MASPFRSIRNDVPLVNQPTPRQSKDEMAADLMEETCLRYKALREAAIAAEQECEPSTPWNPESQECMDTIEALLKGRHRWVCVPVLLEHFPELVVPASDAERDAVDRYLAERKLEIGGDAS